MSSVSDVLTAPLLKSPAPPSMETISINTIRTLCIDAIQAANSGHPGTPMGMAPVAYTLWQQFLRFDPQDPVWPNRDRFVLSAGHASMLLYSLLHLTEVRAVSKDYETLGEVSVPLDAIKTFRQLGSRCPGHPEYRWTSGVETTTGPLGQGLSTSVGMAIGRQWLAERYNRPGFEDLFDFNVYALCGDGCMMEGISSEAASLAGHLQLSNLCWIYDNNHITIEGHTSLTFTEDVATRFIGYRMECDAGWRCKRSRMLARAFRTFQNCKDRPTLIIVDSHIGYGSPHKQDTSEAHGEALGVEEVRLTKRNYGWPEDETFYVPDGVYDHFRQGIGKRGKQLRDAWFARIEEYRKQYPELAEELYRMQHRQLPEDWDRDLPAFPADAKGMATRESSGKVLNAIAKNVPWLIGGAADLAPSTKTRITQEGAGDFQAENYGGRNFHFGIREHAMGAILNGLSLVKVRPFGAGFFIFVDYMRGSMRLSALMEIPVIYVFTHDSIGVGEDGPTHQPIEQLAHMRSMPGLIVIRPADANEVVEAWKVILQLHHEPAVLVLTRQTVPTIDRTKYSSASGLARGAYVLADAVDGSPEVILIGTGSEVALCLEAYEQLTKEGIRARVVSMPSWELFDDQDKNYRDSVLPPNVQARVSVEEASDFGWAKYTGSEGHNVCIETFGASAPLKQLLKKFGFNVEHVVAAAKDQIAQQPVRDLKVGSTT